MKALSNSFICCIYADVIEGNKAYINQKILNKFSSLSDKEKNLLNIAEITKQYEIDKYLDKLIDYVYGMPKLTNAQISRLFKKKLKLPPKEAQYSKNVYLG